MKIPLFVFSSAISSVCLLGACAASPTVAEAESSRGPSSETSPAAASPPRNASTPVSDAAAERREAAFVCQNGEEVIVRFLPAQGTAELVRSTGTAELRQEPAASGFAYRNGPVAIRGEGDTLTMNIGRMKPVQCTTR
jgi:membrane-bound inhibitor of C-type lysozyme